MAVDSTQSPGDRLRAAVRQGTVPMIGVYDVFSATLAARHFEGLFLSGFSFAASHYGLPDVGFIAWSDMVAFAERVRAMLPYHHLLVDVDDGYGDQEIAAHVVCRLEKAGASGVILEDQQRPRRCGHYEGKRLMPLAAYLEKLRRVLTHRQRLFVIARTDAQDGTEVGRRARAFAEAGADAVLVEAVRSLETWAALRKEVKAPLACNQIAGGKTPAWGLGEMAAAGVRLVIYSTPCLFAAQGAVDEALVRLKIDGGRLRTHGTAVTLAQCTSVLQDNGNRVLTP